MTLLFMACTALVFGTVSAIRAIPNLGPRLPAPLVFIVVVMIVTWVFSNAAVRISNRFTRVQYRSLLNNLRCRRAEDTRARNRLLGR